MPFSFSENYSDQFTLDYGIEFSTMLNSNVRDLPVNTFGALDISSRLGVTYKFKNDTEGHIYILQRVYQIGNYSISGAALETKPLNFNLGIKF